MMSQTKWIGHPAEVTAADAADYASPAPLFRRTFRPEGKVKRAELRVSALGIFKARLNGQEVDTDRFAPGWTDYRRRVHCETYDISSLVGAENALTVTVGDGWYGGRLGLYFKRNFYGRGRRLWAEIQIEYADGSKEIIRTDERWKCAFGGVRGDDFFNGEIYDARLEPTGADLFGYDDSAWADVCVAEDVVLLPQPALVERIRTHEVFSPVGVTSSAGGDIYDFGQNMAGFVRIRARGPRGSAVVVRHGEMLRADGSLYTGNLRTARATDTFVLAGEGEETYVPRFTFHGFRYAEISAEGGAEVLSAEAVAVYSDLERTGFFECSSALVNKIYSNVLWGQKSNFVGTPTDCPQRDERLGWTGDAQIFCGTAMYNMNARRFFEKYLQDVRDSLGEDGSVNIIAPCPGNEKFHPSAGWGDVITILPYTHYLAYGDARVLADNVEAMKGWLEYCGAHAENHIRYGPTYGDWLNVDEVTDPQVFETAYYACSARLTALSLRALGREEEAEKYFALFGEIRAAFRRAFMAEDGKIKSDTQACYLFAYSFGLADGSEIKPHLLRRLKERDYHLACGFCGIKYLLPVLCDLGESDLAYRLIAETSYPSWGYSVVNGATTVWERWNSYTIEGGFADEVMNSFNHYSLGSCAEWMYAYALGIRPDPAAPGYRRAVIAPRPDFSGVLTWAKGSYKTPRGEISAAWKVSDGRAEYRLRLPEDMPFAFDYDGEILERRNTGAGEYLFVLGRRKA